MYRPLIGITTRLNPQTKDEDSIVGIRAEYGAAVEAAGGIPFYFPLSDDATALARLFAHADGILLPGGEDVNPLHYKAERHVSVQRVSDVRDGKELWCAREATRVKKPIFGVCRGLQVMNVALGGTLIQDIPSMFSTVVQHRAPEDDRWFHLIHDCRIEAGSKLSAALGVTQLKVNSTHHQSIDRIAPGLRVVAHAEDGIVEGAESVGEWFALGVQCHPEMLWRKVDPRWLGVFKAFVDAARRYAQQS